MDVLYDNLDNYNEENTVAELQTENKELKSKLEEYAVALTKLQKEFDKLSLEHKQLELNYSSLLKTAKAEIERKTQIITNLNLEKDRMVLKSFQNKNAGVLIKTRVNDNPMDQQNYKKDKYEKTKQDEKLKQFEGRKSSPYSASESKEDEPASRDTTDSPTSDLITKLLNLAHMGPQHDSRTVKNSDAKENIMQPKRESNAFKARASIRNRRKSMPVLCTEIEQFSDGDEKQKHIDYIRERPRSRVSETSSTEEKKSGYYESDNHKQRSSRYGRDKNDKYRVRHKSSHRYKRQSPDKYQSGSRDYHDPCHRSEHDRYRTKGRIPNSPQRDKFHQISSQELHRNNYEKSRPCERLPRSQERYVKKRRIEHSYDELENKRVRVEPHSRQFEEDLRIELDNKRLRLTREIESHSMHLEQDRKMRDERKPMDMKYITDPHEIQFTSCESPDYDYREVPNQQVKEIKLTASTKLDDPRIFSKKYVLKKNDGKVLLSTAIGRNIDIVPVTKIAWGIKPVCMPEALVKRPQETKQSRSDKCMEIENSANISIESGEISDFEDINTQNCSQKENKLKVPSSDRNEPPVPITKFYDSKEIKKSLKNINSYKIPKRKSVDDKQSSKDSNEFTLLMKPVDNNTVTIKCAKISDVVIKENYVNTQQAKPAKGKKEPEDCNQENFIIQTKNQLPFLGTINIFEQTYSTAKEVVEGDLEMSDDNCDDKEQTDHDTKGPVSIEMENKTIYNKNYNSKTEKKTTDASDKATLDPCKDKTPKRENKTKHKDKSYNAKTLEQSTDASKKVTLDHCKDKTPKGENKTMHKDKSYNAKTEELSTDASEKVALDPCKDKTPKDDTKKSKTKKKSKHKANNEAVKIEYSSTIFEKPAKKKEKKKETKSIQIKTKFSELFDDSSSLISPEDLGLAAVPTPTTRLPDKCVPFFEDAIDAADLNTIKPDAIKDAIPPENSTVESKLHNEVTVPKIDMANTVIQEDNLKNSEDRSIDVQTKTTDDDIKSIYQNLETGFPEEENVINTVIISSGVQPHVLLEDEKLVPPSKPGPLIKTIQDVSLKVLATSTPHKIWQPDVVMADIDTKLPDSGCNSNNNSHMVSVENTAIMNKSDSNIMDSLTNEANVPDVRIFVKRRRKVLKK